MLSVFAKSFMTATRTDDRDRWDPPAHWTQGERFDNRRNAEIEAHTVARRRD